VIGVIQDGGAHDHHDEALLAQAVQRDLKAKRCGGGGSTGIRTRVWANGVPFRLRVPLNPLRQLLSQIHDAQTRGGEWRLQRDSIPRVHLAGLPSPTPGRVHRAQDAGVTDAAAGPYRTDLPAADPGATNEDAHRGRRDEGRAHAALSANAQSALCGGECAPCPAKRRLSHGGLVRRLAERHHRFQDQPSRDEPEGHVAHPACGWMVNGRDARIPARELHHRARPRASCALVSP
jgi:hypothetical protein